MSREGIGFVKNQYAKELKIAYAGLEKLIRFKYERFSEMHQLHLAQRNYVLIGEVLGDKDSGSGFKERKKCLENSTYYYAEISKLEGIMGNVLIENLVQRIENDIYKNTQANIEDIIQSNWKFVDELIEINGMYKYRKRIETYIAVMEKIREEAQ